MVYEERTYRDSNQNEGMLKFTLIIEESDLLIVMDPVVDEKTAYDFAYKILFEIREDLKSFIQTYPTFYTSHSPLNLNEDRLIRIFNQTSIKNQDVIRRMLDASHKVNVGPMACVAGITSEFLVKAIQKEFKVKNILAENGGDIYMDGDCDKTISIYAGNSPLSNQLALLIKKENLPTSICTSSGTVGHSFSYGKADAVVVVSKNSALADASATAIANLIQTKEDIEDVLKQSSSIENIESIVIIKDDQIGFTDNSDLVRI